MPALSRLATSIEYFGREQWAMETAFAQTILSETD